MLLNEFLKEHWKVEKLEAALEAVNARLKKQPAQIEKVSADSRRLSLPRKWASPPAVALREGRNNQ
jgi:hypothetical protein